MTDPIPFNRPFIVGKELEYIAEAVKLGHIAADGPFTRKCASFLEQRFGAAKVLMTPSCTAALEMAAILTNLGPGDEVLLPSFTFVSTANAVARLGAIPKFVDIRRDTMNIDETLLERAITPRTSAIFVVHYAGVACEMDSLLAIGAKHSIPVIEDAAQGVNAFFGNKSLGTIGNLGAFSFHETKNYISGEGGALVINRAELIERAEIIRDKGTNRKQFMLGLVDKYSWVEIGSSYVPSEICSAFLFAQLEQMDAITERRRRIYERYAEELKPLEHEGLLRLPMVPPGRSINYHMFYVVTSETRARDRLLDHLRQKGIMAVFHYVPLHTSPMGRRFGYKDGDLPVTEEIAESLLRLPFYFDLTEDQQTRVIVAIKEFFQQQQRWK